MNPFKDWLPSKVAISLLPASKGEVQRDYATKAEIQQQNVIINQLIKQVNALTPVSGAALAAWCCPRHNLLCVRLTRICSCSGIQWYQWHEWNEW